MAPKTNIAWLRRWSQVCIMFLIELFFSTCRKADSSSSCFGARLSLAKYVTQLLFVNFLTKQKVPESTWKWCPKSLKRLWQYSKQLMFLPSHHQHEGFQSAYKLYYSTATSLVRVENKILCTIDSNHSLILLLLDLSVFTIDSYILSFFRLVVVS